MRPQRAHRQRLRAQQAAAIVGVDAAKFDHTLAIRVRGRKDTRPLSVPATLAGFRKAEQAIDAATDGTAHGDVIVAIEFAGVYGFTLAHYMASEGVSRAAAVLAVPPRS